jgi:thiol-disulfide isomerase/thioredoxin
MLFMLTSAKSTLIYNFRIAVLPLYFTHLLYRNLKLTILLLSAFITNSYALETKNIEKPPSNYNKAAEFKLLDTHNTLHQLSDYKGSILIVNFWATWCGPCREEIPAMNRAAKQLANDNVVFLAINFGETPSSVSQFLNDYPIDFTVLFDTDNTASSDWGVTVMPTTVIINQHSEVVDTILGPREWDSKDMINAIRSLK